MPPGLTEADWSPISSRFSSSNGPSPACVPGTPGPNKACDHTRATSSHHARADAPIHASLPSRTASDDVPGCSPAQACGTVDVSPLPRQSIRAPTFLPHAPSRFTILTCDLPSLHPHALPSLRIPHLLTAFPLLLPLPLPTFTPTFDTLRCGTPTFNPTLYTLGARSPSRERESAAA